MPINDNNTTVGKCPICLQNAPCMCAFTSDDNASFNWGMDLQTSKEATVIELLMDIKNELAGIKRLLEQRSLKEDLEAILKVR